MAYVALFALLIVLVALGVFGAAASSRGNRR